MLKPKNIRNISTEALRRIRKHIFKHYLKPQWELTGGQPGWDWLPTVICGTCYRAVSEAENKVGTTVNHIDYSDLRPPTPPTRETPLCQCSICWVGRLKNKEYEEFVERMKEPVGRPRIHPLEEPAEPVTVCPKCHSEYGRGKPHNSCNRTTRKANVVELLYESQEEDREEIIAGQLKEVMREKGAWMRDRGANASGGSISLATGATGGNKQMMVTAGGRHESLKPPVRFSHETMARLQLKMGGSDRVIKTVGHFLRVHEGRTCIEENFAESLTERNTKYESFFDHTMITFTEYYTDEAEKGDGDKKKKKKKLTREVSKPLAFCNDVDGLAEEVMRHRGLEPAKTKVQLGIDDGQGLVKVK